jgi:hypothetical protein
VFTERLIDDILVGFVWRDLVGHMKPEREREKRETGRVVGVTIF